MTRITIPLVTFVIGYFFCHTFIMVDSMVSRKMERQAYTGRQAGRQTDKARARQLTAGELNGQTDRWIHG